jgi:phage terminase large subunit
MIAAVKQTIKPKPQQKPYQPFGAALELFYCKEPEVILDGPAGTGKSRGVLEKVHICLQKYEGARGLLARKTRASLTQTAMVTFEQHVLPLSAGVKFNSTAQEYRYPNGSILAVAGLDKPEKIMSSEFDIIAIPEATETTENDIDMLTTRLRNGVMPYQQLIGDCNPQSPKHFLKTREKRGVLKMFPSKHEENPILFDQRTGEITPRGIAYLSKLDNLTGIRKLRLRKGLWVQAEGIVYENYNPEIHLINRYDIPREWRRFWTVDFGYVNPFVWQAWALTPDNVLIRYHEIYMTKRLVEDHAKDILNTVGYEYDVKTKTRRKIRDDAEPLPEKIICDHDAEDRATLERHLGLKTVPAFKDVSPGIQAVESRYKVGGNGKAGIYLMRDSLVEVDKELEEEKKPLCLEDENESYVWDDKKEAPVKQGDHAEDAKRYMVAEIDLAHKPRTVYKQPNYFSQPS